ncbi:MAG: TlpA family protein disulfide reductase, partial [Bacteroidota bacterium]
NVYDPEGWESQTSQQYNIYATPTIFLLDNDLNILAKPISFRDIKQAVEKVSQMQSADKPDAFHLLYL